MPLIIIAAFVITSIQGNTGSSPNARSGPPPPLSLSAPPNAAAEFDDCSKVLVQIEALPITLDGQAPRAVYTTPDTPFVLAWGDPAIIFRCGVERPADLKPYSAALFVNGGVIPGPAYDVLKVGDANVWTTVDRGPYISITVPATYNSGPLPTLSRAIQKAIPAVCNPSPPGGNLCDRRK